VTALDTIWNASSPMDALNDDELDPGIRHIVRVLRKAGFATTDSGDGISKPADERVFDVPHVAATTGPTQLFSEADRMQRLLGDPWVVEATYWPTSGTCVLLATALTQTPEHA
jgi:hypothetical protein